MPPLRGALWASGLALSCALRARAEPMIGKTRRGAADRTHPSRPAKQKAGFHPSALQPGPSSPREILTPRERAVLKQIGRGASSKEAGATLGVSARTIEFHRANIMRKLGVRKIVDLMLLALKSNGDR
jgi:DNA-binding CsgD family transcriptional regulator